MRELLSNPNTDLSHLLLQGSKIVPQPEKRENQYALVSHIVQVLRM